MLRPAVLALCALALLPAVAEAAPPRAISGYLWFSPARGDDREEFRGTLHFTYRTDRRLPERGGFARTQPPLNTQTTVSRRLACYDSAAMVARDGSILGVRGRGLPGSRVRIRVGRGGRVLDRVFTVVRERPGYQRGGLIGCTQDPKALAMYFNLFPTPSVEPEDIFLTANSGPYVRDLRWLRWGTSRAVGRGTFVSECASCGPRVVKGATVVLRARPCPAEGPGALAYVGRITVDGEARRIRIGTTIYC